MMGYKKYGVLVLFLSFLVLCSCALSDETYITPEQEMKQQMMTILQAVIDKDVNTIEELFCPYVREHDEQLEEEIIALFEFIDGDIISYDEPGVYLGSGSMTPLDGYVKRDMGAYIDNIQTSTGKVYSMGYGAYTGFKEKPDYVGVPNMSVFDKSQYDSEDDCPEETEYWIVLPEMFE